MEVIGFSEEEVVLIFQLVSCVLKLGNLQFQHYNNIDGTDGARIANDDGRLFSQLEKFMRFKRIKWNYLSIKNLKSYNLVNLFLFKPQ